MFTISNGGLTARRLAACALLLSSTIASPAMAQAVSDAAGDFLSTYTGPHNGDLDVVSIEASFDGAVFTLDATTAAPIGTTETGLYVWGVDRGKGTAGFAQIGATNVLFDLVVIVNPGAGTVAVRDLVTGTGSTLPASAITVEGNRISVEIPAELLTPQGLEQAEFLVNLWPRNVAGGDETISDFAPDNAISPLTLLFPVAYSASLQTEVVLDDASDRFTRIQRRLSDQRTGIGNNGKLGGYIDAGTRYGNRGLGHSLNIGSNTQSFSIGLDYAATPGFVIGLGLATNKSDIDLAYGGNLAADIVSPEIYASYRYGALNIDGYAAFSEVDYDSRRVLAIGDDLLEATATPSGNATSFGLAASYQLGSDALSFAPVVDVLATSVTVDEYAETDDRNFSSRLQERKLNSVRLGLGMQISHTSKAEWGSISLQAKGRYVTELGDDRDVITYAYNARPDQFFVGYGPLTGVDYGTVELGAALATDGGLIASAHYAPRFDGDGIIDHAAMFSVGIRI